MLIIFDFAKMSLRFESYHKENKVNVEGWVNQLVGLEEKLN